jgi:hypothetical protein
LTIVRSITVMKYATANSANARQRPVFRDGGGIVCRSNNRLRG